MELRSPRGFPIVLSGAARSRATLTVELYEKWYTLFLVHSDNSVEEVLFPSSPNYTAGEAPYVDHVPNPKVVARFARACNYDIDILAFELMVGRWEIEVRDRYTNPGDLPDAT